MREFVELFLSRGVEFVVVGGHAVAYRGYPRLTDDLLLLVRPTSENAERVVQALSDYGFESVAEMNQLVARIAGTFTDAVQSAGGDSRQVDFAIFHHPDFERLETEN